MDDRDVLAHFHSAGLIAGVLLSFIKLHPNQTRADRPRDVRKSLSERTAFCHHLLHPWKARRFHTLLSLRVTITYNCSHLGRPHAPKCRAFGYANVTDRTDTSWRESRRGWTVLVETERAASATSVCCEALISSTVLGLPTQAVTTGLSGLPAAQLTLGQTITDSYDLDEREPTGTVSVWLQTSQDL